MMEATKQVSKFLILNDLQFIRALNLKPFEATKLDLLSHFLILYFRQTIRVEYRGMFRFILVFSSSPFHFPDITVFLSKGELNCS